ncbi:hypothetical protein BRADI_2g20947v3 [Brachypodium distachyon]|uniref:Endonuclease/exonuclease/phosphatase domain-containing protein n=1 Tax=Brachypodium distachyon TaxID=15368 RepID=A0A2K2D9P5_BRADI|nr:hypothetical protein BRADI_2g20947v3 [Brachypodium distachyon]
MMILAWNCRGLGRPRTVQDLVRMVHVHQPKIVFLCKTRQKKNVVESLRWRLGLKNVITVCNDTKGGGLALFWDDSIQWRCTFVYGEPQAHLCHNMWELLRRLKPMGNGPGA